MGKQLNKLISIQHTPSLFQKFVREVLEHAGLQTLDQRVLDVLFALPKGFTLDPFTHKESEYPHRNCFKDNRGYAFNSKALMPLYQMSDEILFNAANHVVRAHFGKHKSLYLNYVRPVWEQDKVTHNFEALEPSVFFIEYFTTHVIGRRDSLLAMHNLPSFGTKFVSDNVKHRHMEVHILSLHNKFIEAELQINKTEDEKRQEYQERRNVNRQSFLEEYHHIPKVDQPEITPSIQRVGIIPMLEDGRVMIHRPKDPDKRFLGYASKIYEFSRGGVELGPGEAFTEEKLMQTALAELWEELGVIGKAATLEFLCDCNESPYGSDQIRYYTIKVKEADFLWEKWQFDPIQNSYVNKNETKGVVITPIKNLSRLFSLNMTDDAFTAIVDMEVLAHLNVAIARSNNTVMPLQDNRTQWQPNVDFDGFLSATFDQIEALYLEAATEKTAQIEQCYHAMTHPKQLTWDGRTVMHADTVYGRRNEGFSLYGFVNLLRQRFGEQKCFNEAHFLDKIETWLFEKNCRNFENKESGIPIHFVRDFEDKNPIEKLDNDFNTLTRIPFYCSTLYAKDISATPFATFTTGFSLQIPNPFFLIADRDAQSAAYRHVFTHANVKERLAVAKTEEDMTALVTDAFYSGDEQKFNDNFYTTIADLLKHSPQTPLRDEANWDFAWKELITCGHFGQMSGILLDPKKELEVPFFLQEKFHEKFGVRLPFMVYENNDLNTYNRAELLTKAFEVRIGALSKKPLANFDNAAVELIRFLNKLSHEEYGVIHDFYLKMPPEKCNNRVSIMLILCQVFENIEKPLQLDALLKKLHYDESLESLKQGILQLSDTITKTKCLNLDFIDLLRPIDDLGIFFTLYKCFQNIPDLKIEYENDIQKNKGAYIFMVFLKEFVHHNWDKWLPVYERVNTILTWDQKQKILMESQKVLLKKKNM